MADEGIGVAGAGIPSGGVKARHAITNTRHDILHAGFS